MNVGNLISGSFSFSKPSLDVWKFLVCIMLKPSMQDFKHDLTSMSDECNCLMAQFRLAHSLVLPFLGTGMRIDFSSPVATAGSSRFAVMLNETPWRHHPLGFWIVLLEFCHIPSLCFLKPTWLRSPECLALDGWPQHCNPVHSKYMHACIIYSVCVCVCVGVCV